MLQTDVIQSRNFSLLWECIHHTWQELDEI
jgi:hypothetical protein